MDRYLLLTEDELQEIIDKERLPVMATKHYFLSMALELREYRKIYGPLGCQWLANEIKK